MSETADRVKKIVVEHLGVEADKVTEEASFIDDLGADSLDIVELVMAFEEEFGVEIPDDAAEKITTVRDAIEYIDQQQGLMLETAFDSLMPARHERLRSGHPESAELSKRVSKDRLSPNGLGPVLPSGDVAMRRVVVTGLGLVTPLGGDVETTWTQSHRRQKRDRRRSPASTPRDQKAKIAGEVKPKDHAYRLRSRQARRPQGPAPGRPVHRLCASTPPARRSRTPA